MSCICHCHNAPDAVDKKDWKCVKCGHDLQEDFKRVQRERERKALRKSQEVDAVLLDSQIKDLVEKRKSIKVTDSGKGEDTSI